ncbi:MAG: uracil-DNA glycosylase [Candidatus Saccharimonadales bacterium]
MMEITKQQQLDQIKAEIISNNVCPNLAKQATQLVFGAGSADADIVFIGEAPGKNEDEQGLPFVGAAGKFLNDMLAMIGLKREDVYITNIVKYRPPNNRDPLPGEKQEFLPFLEKQLEVVGPKLVITLGRHSLNCFLPELSISQVHGQPKRIKLRLSRQSPVTSHADETSDQRPATRDLIELVILPLYHPAAALYNGGMRQTLIDDFVKIPLILRKLET